MSGWLFLIGKVMDAFNYVEDMIFWIFASPQSCSARGALRPVHRLSNAIFEQLAEDIVDTFKC